MPGGAAVHCGLLERAGRQIGLLCRTTLRLLVQRALPALPPAPQVMVLGTLLHGKSYSLLEYVCCILISGKGHGGAAWACMHRGAS